MKSDSIQRHRARLLSHAQHLRALLGIILATCACMLALTPAPAYAADSGVITKATVVDSASETGREEIIDITQENQRVADINAYGMSEFNRTAYGKPHAIHVELSNLSNQGTGLNKTIEVKLALGVKWVTDTDITLNKNLDTSKGTNGIQRVALSKIDNKFEPAGGTRIYYLQDGLKSISFDLDYTVDPLFMSETGTQIKDPITITVKEGSRVVGRAKLNALTNNVNSGVADGLPKWNGVKGNTSFERVIGATNVSQNMDLAYLHMNGRALRDELIATLVVSDPRAQLICTNPNVGIFDESGAASGIYQVKAETNPYVGNFIKNSFAVVLPEDAGFVAGESFTITGHYEFKGYDVDGKQLTKTADVTYTVTAAAPKRQIYINSTDASKPVKDLPNYRAYVNNGEGMLSAFTLSSEMQENGKTVEQKFDPNAHIYAVWVLPPAGTRTVVGMTFDVQYIPEGSSQPQSKRVTLSSDTVVNPETFSTFHDRTSVISYGDLGLKKNDSITMLRYQTDIPDGQNIQLRAYGRLDDMSLSPTSMLEIYHLDADHKKVTTGVATTTAKPEDCISLRPLIVPSITVEAGKRTNVINAGANGWTMSNDASVGMRNPIYYVVIKLKDNAGNFLKLNSVGLRPSENPKYLNVTDDVMEERVVPEVGRIYTIDTLKLAAKYATESDTPLFNSGSNFVLSTSAGKYIWSPDCRLHFRIDVPKNVENQSQTYASMIYVEDRYYDNTVQASSAATSRTYLDSYKVDLYKMGISQRQHANGKPYFAISLSEGLTDSLTVRADPDFTVDTSVKHESAKDYTVWNEGDKPITVGNSSSFDIKVDLNNASGAATRSPVVIYVPIPKKGADWKGLSYNKDISAFDVRLNKVLTYAGKTSQLNSNHVHIEYGRVTPSDSGDTLAGGTWSSTFNAAQAENYNCVRITVDEIPANDPEKGTDTYSFIMNCSAASTATEEGAVNTFRTLYYKDFEGKASGFYTQEGYTSIEAALGEIRGRLFVDKDKDGDLSSGEELTQANVEVQALKGGTAVATAKTDAQGQYHFKELRTGDIYVLRVNNPDKNKYVFARPGTANVQGQPGNSTNQFIGQSNDTVGQAAAAYPMKPVGSNPTAATYNIGLMDKNAKTTISFNAGEGKVKANNQATYSVSGAPTATLADPGAERAGYTYFWYKLGDTNKTRVSFPVTYGYDNQEFVAEWVPRERTQYKVEWYEQAANGSWGTAARTATRYAATGADITLEGDDLTVPAGFALDSSKSVTTGKVDGSGNLVLKVYFKRQFSVTFKQGEHGAWENATVLAGSNFDYNATTPAAPADYQSAQAGWEFDGWKADGENNTISAPYGKVTRNITYTAQWKGKGDETYKVETYYQDKSMGIYPKNPDKTETRTGTTGQTVSLLETDYNAPEGYAYDRLEANVTKATLVPGETTLKVYFRLSFKVTFDPGTQGTWKAVEYPDCSYGQNMPSMPETEVYKACNPGYEFNEWSRTYDANAKVYDNIRFVATWKAIDGGSTYKVEYYYDGKLEGTDERHGTAGTQVSVTDDDKKPSSDNYVLDEAADNVFNGTVDGNGAPVLKIYFKRQYTVTYAPGEAGLFKAEDYTFKGLDLNAATPAFEGDLTNAQPGYEFIGWHSSLTDTVVDEPETTVTGDVTYTAQWKANKANYTVELYYMQKYGIWPEKAEVLTQEGIIGQEVTFDKALIKKTHTLSNYRKSTLKGTVAADGSLTLKVYCDIASGTDPCFPDVPSKEWYHRVVHICKDFTFIEGYKDGTFKPNRKITRAQVVVILWRMSGAPEGYKCSFKDVKMINNDPKEPYYYRAVAWAQKEGVVDGYGTKKDYFKPTNNITREELAAMLYKYTRNYKGRTDAVGSYSIIQSKPDAKEVTKELRNAMGWANKEGLITGSDKTGELNPKGNTLRSEAAKMFEYLYRFLNK